MPVAVLAHPPVHLRGEYDVVASALQRFADNLFRLPLRVHVRGIDEVDAGVERGIDDAGAIVMIGVPPSAEHHRPEAVNADADAGRTQHAVFHDASDFGQPNGRVRPPVVGAARPGLETWVPDRDRNSPNLAQKSGNKAWHRCIVEAMPGTASQHGNDLTALYDREHAPMLRVACLLVGERAIAEEIVHDAFATVSERWTQLDNPGGYLRTTVVNGCRMAMRRRATERRHAPTDAATVAAPTELIELRAALDQLRERERAVIVLRYFVDIPDAEIAQLLGCREATVRSTVHRALKTLRKELS